MNDFQKQLIVEIILNGGFDRRVHSQCKDAKCKEPFSIYQGLGSGDFYLFCLYHADLGKSVMKEITKLEDILKMGQGKEVIQAMYNTS